MTFDSRLNRLIEILRFVYHTLKRMGVAQARDLVPPKFVNDEHILRAIPDLVTYFNLGDKRSGKYYFKLRDLSGDRLRLYERRVDRLVVLKLKLFQIFFWKAVSRSADEFEPHERLADVREFLRSYGLSEELAHTYIAMMLVLGRARTQQGGGGGIRVIKNARLPDGRQPARGELVLITPSRQNDPREGEKSMAEQDLYKSLKFYFQQTRQDDEVSEHFEYKGWKCSIVDSKEDGSTNGRGFRLQKDAKKPDWGNFRNPDVVGYRVEKCNPLGTPEIEVLAVEIKDEGEFNRETIAQATSYLEFANVVYIAIDAPYRELKKRTLLINACMKAGIGIISLEGDIPKNRDDDAAWPWEEAVPARYQIQRRRANAFILETYFPHAIARIKNEFYGEMGPFKLQVPG